LEKLENEDGLRGGLWPRWGEGFQR